MSKYCDPIARYVRFRYFGPGIEQGMCLNRGLPISVQAWSREYALWSRECVLTVVSLFSVFLLLYLTF